MIISTEQKLRTQRISPKTEPDKIGYLRLIEMQQNINTVFMFAMRCLEDVSEPIHDYCTPKNEHPSTIHAVKGIRQEEFARNLLNSIEKEKEHKSWPVDINQTIHDLKNGNLDSCDPNACLVLSCQDKTIIEKIDLIKKLMDNDSKAQKLHRILVLSLDLAETILKHSISKKLS